MASRDGEQLVGRWRLVSLVARAADGSLAFPLGRNAQGSLLYTAEGWMAAQIGSADRERFTTEDPIGASEADRLPRSPATSRIAGRMTLPAT
jgi:Lipocalin-like domain